MNCEGVLMEEIRDQNNKILEILATLKDVPSRLNRIEEDISELKSDMKVVKLVLKQHTADIAELKAAR